MKLLYIAKFKNGNFAHRAYLRPGYVRRSLTDIAKYNDLDGTEIIEVDASKGKPVKVLRQGKQVEGSTWLKYEKPTYVNPVEESEQEEPIKEDLSSI